MTPPQLAYVALVVSQPAEVAAQLAKDFEVPCDGLENPFGGVNPGLALGQTLLVFFDAEDPFVGGQARPGLHHLGFECANPADLAASIGVEPAALSTGLKDTQQLSLPLDKTAGVNTRLCSPLPRRQGASQWVERIDHIGVASIDNTVAEAAFTQQLGCPVESRQTDFEVSMALESFTSDKYGVVYHNRAPEPIGGLRVSFITVGDCELEFLAPVETAAQTAEDLGHAPGNTRGDKGAISRYIERRGQGLHHLALKTPNIDATLNRLSRSSRQLIDHTGRPGSRRAKIGFVHPKSFGGLLVHFVERTPI